MWVKTQDWKPHDHHHPPWQVGLVNLVPTLQMEPMRHWDLLPSPWERGKGDRSWASPGVSRSGLLGAPFSPSVSQPRESLLRCHAASSLRRSCGDVQAQPLKAGCPRIQLELFVTLSSTVLHLGFFLHHHPNDRNSDLLRKEECF